MSHKTWRTIDMELTRRSIAKAIREIEDCQRQLTEAMNALIRKLAEEGAQVARMQVAGFDAVDSGDLEHSIYGYFDPASRIGYVIAGSAHAFYVEYGTGIIGAMEPHPEAAEAGWEYMVGDHITIGPGGHIGWWYKKGSSDIFSSPELGGDGEFRFTRGQPARPFMYNTLVWLEEAAEALGREIFS